MEPDSVWNYSRYWMGFRVVLRFLLVFLDYFQIRRYLAVLFYALYGAVICSLAKRVGAGRAFVFALSIALVRPQVIANSLQYSCCFLIAFGGMLLVPWLDRHRKWEGLFFLEIGIVTMFFDFYTVPLLTVCLPLLYLCVLRERMSWSRVGKDLLLWLLGYGLMWLMKLGLTSALTSVDALGDGIASFLGRVGIVKVEELEQYYDLSFAFDRLRQAIFTDEEGKWIYLAALLAVAVGALVQMLRRHIPLRAFGEQGQLLLLALLPWVWFCVTKQPIAIHYMFQYRSIVVTYCAVGFYLCQVLTPRTEARSTVPERIG